jgi:2',3'-cyclic-nucleotide 2'-phosphodiesterase / 3'-nucleotidase / 5'-nucleotidase
MPARPRSMTLAAALVAALLWPAAAAADEHVTLTLLHNNDGESSLAPIAYTVGEERTPVLVAGAAAFSSVLAREVEDAREAGNAVLTVYAGDAFLASATLACSLPPQPDDTPVHDAVAQALMPYDVHILGNHEFDYGPDFLLRFARELQAGRTDGHPFLSATLDFSGEPAWADLVAEDGLIRGRPTDGRFVGRSAILEDPGTGERFGIVGATTWALPTISSPRDVSVTADLDATVAAVQAEVDRLLDEGIDRIILVSHLQDVDNDRELVARLRNVDLAVAGGGDELLVSEAVDQDAQLLPGEDPGDVAGSYPLMQPDADGRSVPIVTTAGSYKYVGRIDVTFGPDGEVVAIDAERSYPRRVIPAGQEGIDLAELGIEDAVEPDPAVVAAAIEPVDACLAEFAATPILRSEVVINVARGGFDPFALGVRSAETNGGNLVADAFLAAFDRYADASGLPDRGGPTIVVAVQNGGGIRQTAGNLLPAGGTPGETVTRLDTLNLLPFDNTLVVVEGLSAEDLRTVLERSCESVGGGGFLQVSAFRYTCDMTAEVGGRVRDVVVTGDAPSTMDDVTLIDADGAIVAPGAVVHVVTNSFTASGGDDYPTFAAAVKSRLVDEDGTALFYERALREHLESFPVVGDPPLPTLTADDPRYAEESGEGRITIVQRE